MIMISLYLFLPDSDEDDYEDEYDEDDDMRMSMIHWCLFRQYLFMALQCKSDFNRNIHVGVPVGQSRKKKVTFSRQVLAIPPTFPPLTHSTGPKPSQLVPKF